MTTIFAVQRYTKFSNLHYKILKSYQQNSQFSFTKFSKVYKKRPRHYDRVLLYAGNKPTFFKIHPTIATVPNTANAQVQYFHLLSLLTNGATANARSNGNIAG